MPAPRGIMSSLPPVPHLIHSILVLCRAEMDGDGHRNWPFCQGSFHFISFYASRSVPFFFFVVTYFNSNLVSSTPFYAPNSFIFGFALARNGTCAPTHHDGITEQKFGASAGNALRVDCFFCWFPSIAKNRNQWDLKMIRKGIEERSAPNWMSSLSIWNEFPEPWTKSHRSRISRHFFSRPLGFLPVEEKERRNRKKKERAWKRSR